MRLGVVTLAASTVVLAGSTVYFARELASEREHNSAVLVESGSVATAPGPPGTEPAAATPPGQSTTPPAAAASAPGSEAHADGAAGSASVAESRLARNRAQAAEFLRLYENPETRAKLLKTQVENHLSMYSGLRSELDIDAERFDRLIKLFAEQQLDRHPRMRTA